MLKRIKMIGCSDVILSLNQMKRLKGGGFGCGCCICDPKTSADGAGSTTAQVSTPPFLQTPTPEPGTPTPPVGF